RKRYKKSKRRKRTSRKRKVYTSSSSSDTDDSYDGKRSMVRVLKVKQEPPTFNGYILADAKRLFPLDMQLWTYMLISKSYSLGKLLRHLGRQIEGIEHVFADNARFTPASSKQMLEQGSDSKPSKQDSHTQAEVKDSDPTVSVNNWPCQLCNPSDHSLPSCRLSYQEMRDIAFNRKLCFKCFNPGHDSRNCRRSYKCKHCNHDHLSFLCKRITVWEALKKQPKSTVKHEYKQQW